MKKENYWTDKHERLCEEWTQATTQKEYSRIYEELYPALKRMAHIILKRYFAVPFHMEDETEIDAIQETFLKLHLYEKERGKSGAYTFCSLIIKRNYHTKLVIYPKYTRDLTYSTTTVGEFQDYQQPLEYEEYVIPQETYDMLINKFKEIKQKYEKIIKQKLYARDRINIKTAQNYIKMLNFAIQYVQEYNNANPQALTDYVMINAEIKRHTVTYFLRKELGLNVNGAVPISTNDADVGYKSDSRVDDRYSPFQDDRTPNEDRDKKRQRMKYINGKIENYEDYLYF
jgi:hypothetical protein